MITTIDQAKRLLQIGYPSPVPPKELQPKDINGNLMFPIRETNDFQVLISKALQWIRDNKGVECAVELVRQTNRFHSVMGSKYGGAYIDDDKKEILLDEVDSHPLAESALLDAILNYLIEKKDEV